MNVDSKIATALFNRLKALTFTPTLTIAWPNVRFDKPATGKYLEVNLLPNDTEGFGLGGTRVFMGFFQVNVTWPLNVGLIQPRDTASAIQDQFAKGTRLEYDGVQVEINDPPYQGRELIEEERLIIPVSVPYRAHI